MRVESCSVCLEDLNEHVEARYYCSTCGLYYCLGDGKRHAKKYTDHVLDESILTNLGGVSSQSILLSSSSLNNLNVNCGLSYHEICKDHGYPINSYCRTCEELICAACSLDSSHKSHDCHLIDQIFNDEKIKFRVDLETLKKRVAQFENMTGGNEKQLVEEITEIEKKRIIEEDCIDQLFDNIINKANDRREYLKKSLNDLATERTKLILDTMEMKEIIERDALIHLDRIEEMSRIELMKHKVTLLKNVQTSYDKMLSNMRFSNIKYVHNFCLETDKDTENLALDLIDNLGHVSSTLTGDYQVNQVLICNSLPAEFYYERTCISKEYNLFKKKSHAEHSIIFSSKKISEGIVKWRVHLDLASNWIGVGVCQQSVYDDKDFTNFKSPYLDHKLDMISSNGYLWSCSQRILNHTQKGFLYLTGEDIELELNCDTKTLSFRKGMYSCTIKEIQLPVYPVIVLLSQDDTASMIL